MTKQKSNRIFLGIVTGAMALAGTGLTIANNFSIEIQALAVALTLAACFTAAEATFLWGHKRFEDSTKLWRKCTLAISLALLVASMGFAVYEELNLALGKISNNSLAESSAKIVSSADKLNQTKLGRTALRNLSKEKININAVPFVVCYIISGLVSIAILAVSERQRTRTVTYGNQLPHKPELQERVRALGFVDPLDAKSVKAYRDNRERGYSIHAQGKYRTFISDKDLYK